MEVSSYIESKIERYIQEVLRQLPRAERKAAREKLENTIYSMLEAYAGDNIPDSQHLRYVFRDLGTPDQAASAYYVVKERELEMSKEQGIKIPLKAGSIQDILHILMICSVALLVLGILGMVMNAVSDVRLFFVGCVLALAVQMAQVIVKDRTGKRRI